MTDSKTVVEDLAAWLTAVWDEDTRRFGGHEEDCDEQFGRPCDCIYGELLARIAADRKILDGPQWGGPDHWDEWLATIRILASAYADRPGFRSEWLVERQGVEG